MDQSLLLFSAQLHDRIAKIDRLRKRYEILMVSMAPPEGEEEHSQTYYVIKVFSLFFAFDLSLSLSLLIYLSISLLQAAQEREEIQREGDELDAKIRKAEKEIQALENTLALMNVKNEKYRKSLQNFDPTG